MLKRLLSLALCAMLMLTACAWLPARAEDALDDFTVTTIDGETLTLSGILKEKKMVFINFFTTWCYYCKVEFPYMNAAYKKHKDDVLILGLDPDGSETAEQLKSFRKEHKLTFPIADSTQALTGSLAAQLGVNGYPTSVVIDRFGHIAMTLVGAQPSANAFAQVFDYFTSDDYTSPETLNAIPAKAKKKAPKASAYASLVPSGDPITVEASGSPYQWPFVADKEKGVFVSSNQGVDNSVSTLRVTVEAEAGDALLFDRELSAESPYDQLLVERDGEVLLLDVGTIPMSTVSVPLKAGRNSLSISYFKDGADSAGDDRVRIKDLRLGKAEEEDGPTEPTMLGGASVNLLSLPDSYPYKGHQYAVTGADGSVVITLPQSMNSGAFALHRAAKGNISPLPERDKEGTFTVPALSEGVNGYDCLTLVRVVRGRYAEYCHLWVFKDEQTLNDYVSQMNSGLGSAITWEYAQ